MTTLSEELHDWLIEKRPDLRGPENTAAIAECTVALAKNLGCMLAPVFLREGSEAYDEAVRTIHALIEANTTGTVAAIIRMLNEEGKR